MKEDHNFNEIMKKLNSKARPENIEGMSRFGIMGDGRLGLSMPELRKMGKSIGEDHNLALKLWTTKIT